MAELPRWARSAGALWRWRGDDRPPFAIAPGAGQESVWDYPRPPRIVPDARDVVVLWGGRRIASTRRALRVLETASPPGFYLSMADVDERYLEPAPGGSMCEWKGAARYWTLRDGDATLPAVGWSYPEPYDGMEVLAGHIAFYPSVLACFVDGARVLPQPGGFYGGWITPDVTGPFKGAPGSGGW